MFENEIAILREERTRILGRLSEADPGTDAYGNLLYNMQNIHSLIMNYRYEDEDFAPRDPITNMEPPAEEAPALVEVPVEKSIIPDKEPIIINDLEEQFDYDKVRAICANADKPLRPIIEKYVPEGKEPKLSNIPADRYAELVKEIRNA